MRLGSPQRLLRFLKSLSDIQAAVVDHPEGPLDLQSGLRTESGTLESDGVDAGHHAGSIGRNKGRDVFGEALPSPHHAEPSHTQELVKDRAPSEYRSILHLDITGQQTVVGNNDPVADRGVVTEMDADHQEIIVTNSRYAPLLGAAMDRHVFADDIVITDEQLTLGAGLEIIILRVSTQDGSVPYGIPSTHPDVSRDHSMSLDPAPFTDHGAGLNDGSRPDLHIGGKLG